MTKPSAFEWKECFGRYSKRLLERMLRFFYKKRLKEGRIRSDASLSKALGL